MSEPVSRKQVARRQGTGRGTSSAVESALRSPEQIAADLNAAADMLENGLQFMEDADLRADSEAEVALLREAAGLLERLDAAEKVAEAALEWHDPSSRQHGTAQIGWLRGALERWEALRGREEGGQRD